MMRLRYLGMIPKAGHREYGFHVDGEDKSVRQIVLTIDDMVFLEKRLKFQEAPDLCYQKMKCELENEQNGAPIKSPMNVTPSDVAKYRDSHPDTKARQKR